MNYKLLLTSAFFVTTAVAVAQNANKAIAITGDGHQDFIWMNIRQVDLGTGKVLKTIFERNKSNFILTDVKAKTVNTQASAVNANIFQSKDYPTGSMVAAAAYDRRSNKLFFSPMRVGELRWLDLDIKNETPKFYSLSSEALNFGNAYDEANHITRMVIAADGNGYAVTNDGNHFIKFTTGKKPVITDLGNLIDNEKNNGISIHNKCTSWGGDMLADAMGKLYLISANRQVFVVDIESRIATHKGTISGLPANYTTNAAAVNAEGDIVVSSANVFEGYYSVKLADLSATAIQGSDRVFNASDLANGNLLLQKEADAARKFAVTAAKLPENIFSNADKRVFPNPVTASTFAVLFSDQKAGNYSVTLSDLSGRILQTQKVNITKGMQTETVNLLNKPAKGMYMVKVYDDARQIVFTEKVLIQ
jgi:Secretion system C-terminal sorting domain